MGWEGYGNKTSLNLGTGIGMAMNSWERQGLRLKQNHSGSSLALLQRRVDKKLRQLLEVSADTATLTDDIWKTVCNSPREAFESTSGFKSPKHWDWLDDTGTFASEERSAWCHCAKSTLPRCEE